MYIHSQYGLNISNLKENTYLNMHKRRQPCNEITYSDATLAAGQITTCQCKVQRPVSSPNTIQDLIKKYRVEGKVRYCHLTVTKSNVSCLTIPTLDIKWGSVYAICESESGSTWLYKISYNKILYKTYITFIYALYARRFRWYGWR